MAKTIRKFMWAKPGTTMPHVGTQTITEHDNVAAEIFDVLVDNDLNIKDSLLALNTAIYWTLYAASINEIK